MKSNYASARTASGIFARSAAAPRAVIRSVAEAVNAQCGQPAMLRLEPLRAFVMMLRQRAPRMRRKSFVDLSGRSGLRLPAGCVLAVRYQSR